MLTNATYPSLPIKQVTMVFISKQWRWAMAYDIFQISKKQMQKKQRIL